MMASALLPGAPPARRGAGHPRPDGEAEGEPMVELAAATTTPPAGMRGHASRAATVQGLLAGQGGPQAFLADMPEVMLDAVDQGHRDLVPVLPQMAVGPGDVELLPGHIELGRDPGDDLARVVTQVTP